MAPENTLNPQAGRPRGAAQAALGIAVCAALCGIDLAALACAPARAQAAVSNVAVPFDLMACVPAAFYLLVVRPRKLTPLIALPVIYAGGLVSAQIAQPDAFSLIGPLLLAAGAVDVLVAVREGARLARAWRAAKLASSRPCDRFERTCLELVPNGRAARLLAAELSVWWYLLRSWRTAPDVPEGSRAFAYHRRSGCLGFMGGMMGALCIETLAAHLLVSAWSVPAACCLSALSLYAMAWMAGIARSIVLCPLLVGDAVLTVRWGFANCADIPFDRIERIASDACDIPKRERLSLASLGADPCWIVLREPVEIPSLAGARRSVRAIGVCPDEEAAFKRAVEHARRQWRSPEGCAETDRRTA